jgi:DNA-binding transcriptional LysR family regulator
MAIIAESLTPELLTRGLIEGTLDVAVMLEPAQLEMLCIEEVATIELILVSDQRGLAVDEALDDRYVYVDWGLAHGLEHRGMFPGAAEAMTRVSQAKMALEYITAVGGSAYLPRGMAADGIAAGRLHIVADAPVFKRRAYAAYPLRSAHRELVEACISLLGAAD